MINCQRSLFSLPKDIVYLNGAYMSPQLKAVEKIGIAALKKKNTPYLIGPGDFFEGRQNLNDKFARLISAADPSQIAIIPSASYGLANVVNNIKLKAGEEILLAEEQFPSNVYHWQRIAKEAGAIIKMIKPPEGFSDRGRNWNLNILESINSKTAVVAMPQVHWADGTLFDLPAIREKTKKVGALLILDGTQSVGAFPFSVEEIKPDALICAGYKWLMGPYSLGLAYYGEYFMDGKPIEENWINRLHSEDFRGLTAYQEQYQLGAERFSVGESSNFNLVPMLNEALDHLLQWKPEEIQAYCDSISKPTVEQIREKGYFIEADPYRAKHLFGIYLKAKQDLSALKSELQQKLIFVSYRGEAIRVSAHLYNTTSDFEQLGSCF